MTRETDRLLSIGVALSAERNISKLHELIVREARQLTRADSGSLFLLEQKEGADTALRFAVAQSGPDDAGTHLGAILPLTRGSLSGYVALSGDVLRIGDAYEIPETMEYRFNPSFDKQNGYRTKSVLCVPMRDHENAIVGVIQLINRKPEFELKLTSPAMTEEVVTPFTKPVWRWKIKRSWNRFRICSNSSYAPRSRRSKCATSRRRAIPHASPS
jgi:GAF domain-containing protein